jgi:protein archease
VSPDFEILEHTADIGIKVSAPTLAGALEVAVRALAEVAGVWRPGPGDETAVEVQARDVGGLMVEWLSEVLYLYDSRTAVVCGARVRHANEQRASGTVCLAPSPYSVGEGTEVKAITYHQLEVKESEDGWRATVFLDI